VFIKAGWTSLLAPFEWLIGVNALTSVSRTPRTCRDVLSNKHTVGTWYLKRKCYKYRGWGGIPLKNEEQTEKQGTVATGKTVIPNSFNSITTIKNLHDLTKPGSINKWD